MDSLRIKRVVIGLAILVAAYLVIESLLFLWNIVVLLIVVALISMAGFFGFRAWKRQQASAGGSP